MTEQELKDRFIGIHAEYKDINSTLQLLTQEQIRSNAENKSGFKDITQHLSRLNNSVARHEDCIQELNNYRLESETIKEVKEEARRETKANRRLLYAALSGLLMSIIINLWERFFV